MDSLLRVFSRVTKRQRNLLAVSRVVTEAPKSARMCIRESHTRSLLTSKNKLFLHKSPYCKVCHTVGSSLKSHTCGELRVHHVGQEVTLRGYLQFQRMGKFAVLRDAFGKTQVLIKDEEMATGKIEVLAHSYQVLSRARHDLPFLIRDFNKPKEQLRLKYRYLDLRHAELQKNLRLKSQVAKKMRDYLQDKEAFVELTTPTLSVNTPGGAQEFVVPSRLRGKFYSLVQSPQTYKQLAMIGGFDKYFQFAVCYRDEGGKPDRQPEFMQVDLEMANVTMSEVKCLIENLLVYSWPSNLPAIHAPFPVLTYTEAMNTYGVDKPDTRFEWKLQDVTHLLENCGASVLEKAVTSPGTTARAFIIPGGQSQISKKMITSWENLAKREHNLPGVSVFYTLEDLTLKGNIAKKMNPASQKELTKTLRAQMEDVLVLSVGPTNKVLGLLGKLRLLAAKVMEESGVAVRNQEHFNFLWVIDFPLFELDDDTGRILSVHHPFTLPIEEDSHYLYTDPLKARSQHYDLVLNGCEVGGGSIRIHNPAMQRYVLQNIMDIDPASLGFFTEALEFGAPPHGGIALGFDRLIAEMCGANSIRDVIAFPKSMEGRCLMSGAPGDITHEEQQRYHISIAQDDGKDNPENS
ncbi:Aspartate--tRNA ligase-like [Homarus americanus]|uniref:Aspartate--tRNA ligase-like n=1 Tax=Homarus americanus TaxID=6706 RepID=A0A8J5N9M7_HOMAM|nr:Aspartate--tRNA ligase-like [Homarus americanus]